MNEKMLSNIEMSILNAIGNDPSGKSYEDVRVTVNDLVGKPVSDIVVNTFLSRLKKQEYIECVVIDEKTKFVIV